MNSEPTDLQIPAEPVSFCCGVQPVIEYVPLADNGNDRSDVRVVCPRCNRRGPDKPTIVEATRAWNSMFPLSADYSWKTVAVVAILGMALIAALAMLALRKVDAKAAEGVNVEEAR